MNFVQRGLAKLALKMAGVSGTYSTADPALGKIFGTPTVSGMTVNEDSAMRISTAWSCIRILSETMGAMPWGMYESDGRGNSKPAPDHPLSELLSNSPNADMTSVEYREAKVTNLCQAGNTYSLIDRTGKRVTSLTPIRSCNVTPLLPDASNPEIRFKILDRGKYETYPRSEIWHVKGFGGDGYTGLSPLGAAREAMGTALAVESFGARFFSQGGKPSGIVTVPNFFKKEQREIARENLQQMMGGLGAAHQFALFEGGMKPEPWGDMPLDDMQFLLLRKFSIQEICRFYRIPPHMVADLDRATFSNIEHMSQEFVMFTLMPYFTRFESSVTKWLLPPGERGKFFLRFNFEGLLRADSAGRAAFLTQMVTNGVMNRNEARGKENLNRSDAPGMDEFTVQLAMAPISKLGPMADATIAAGNRAPVPVAAKAAEDQMSQAIEGVFNLLKTNSHEETGIGVKLPKHVGDDIRYIVDHPAVKALVASVHSSEARTKERFDQVQREVKGLVDAVEQSVRGNLERIARAANAPRKAIYDADGNVIGSEPVDNLELH